MSLGLYGGKPLEFRDGGHRLLSPGSMGSERNSSPPWAEDNFSEAKKLTQEYTSIKVFLCFLLL